MAQPGLPGLFEAVLTAFLFSFWLGSNFGIHNSQGLDVF